MNRLPEALAAYEEIIRQHPNEVIPKNGHAEVLKAMDRLPEALTAYEEIIRQHPNEVVTKNGRAEVLKAMNRLPEALAAYRSNLALYPYAERTRCGLACVLAAMGKWDEALAELPDKDPVTPAEWVAYHIRGMILLRTGSPELAVQIFERGAQSNPRPAARDYFRTALAVARIKQGNPSLATPILVEVESAALKVPANRILVHAFGAQGQTENAAHAYRGLTQPRFGPILELSEELRRRYVDLQEPRHSEEWLTFREIDCLLLAA
jgi:tetratricopeptide (TPR) repeat protein